MHYIVEGEGCSTATRVVVGKRVGCACFELQSGCATCNGDSSIEGDGDIDSRTYTVAAVSSGSGDSSNFGGSVEEDGDIIAELVR